MTGIREELAAMRKADNPRAAIGDNSGAVGVAPEFEPERAALVRGFSRELNQLRNERGGIGDDEKDIKAELKALGFSPKVIGIAKRAKLSKKEDPVSMLDLAMALIDETSQAPSPEIQKAREQMKALEEIAERRRDLADRERNVKARAVDAGVNLRALTIARSLLELDSEERVAIFDALVAYGQNLKCW